MPDLSKAMANVTRDEAIDAHALTSASVLAQLRAQRDQLRERANEAKGMIEREMVRLRAEGERVTDICRAADALALSIQALEGKS